MWFSHASGIIIKTECGKLLPPKYKSSKTSSNEAESLPEFSTIGNKRFKSPGIRSLSNKVSLALIQFRLPFTVLISPLCAMYRYGWASGQDGNVFVENLECTKAIADSTSGFDKSGKKSSSWPVVSIPL